MEFAVPPLLLAAALALAPQGSLACADPVLRAERPDGQYVMTVCRRASWRFAMPGQGSDAPGWVVLRDRAGISPAWSISACCRKRTSRWNGSIWMR